MLYGRPMGRDVEADGYHQGSVSNAATTRRQARRTMVRERASMPDYSIGL